jgi:glycosyltransferase involved in cell wall biosynthesis
VARILMLTQPTDGGVFEHVAALCAGLADRGHEPLVGGPFAGQPAGLRAEVLPLDLVRAVSPSADLRAALEVVRLVRRVRPDVVHAHSSKAGAVARMARPAFWRVPLVYTPHGYAFAGYFERAAERRAYRAAERLLAPLATLTLCVCRAEQRLADGIGPRRRTRVVHNGVPPAEPGPPAPAVATLREGGPVVGALTLLRPGKGIETLVDALPRLLAAVPDVRVAVAGEGPDRAALEERAHALGVDHALHLIGHTPGAMALLAGSDVFVSASWAESFPYNVLEAMAAGVPIVATDVGGTGEAIEDGASGLLVPPRDPEALADALSALLTDRTRAATLGAKARARQERMFTVGQMVDGTLEVYGECADGISNMTPCGVAAQVERRGELT